MQKFRGGYVNLGLTIDESINKSPLKDRSLCVSPNSNPKMNDADVSKQIEQMVRFIRQEAEEKANEISVSAEEVSQLESNQMESTLHCSIQCF